jgi:very-short-patch-repair endonuclease
MNKQSETERILLRALKNMGLHPMPQCSISRMTVDFAFLEKGVVIEIDGVEHRTRKGMETDHERDEKLQELGWKVRRFTAEQTYEDPNDIARRISNFLDKNQGTPVIEEYEHLIESRRETETKEHEPQTGDRNGFIWFLIFVIIVAVIVMLGFVK